jgi:hypothetical protein
MSFWTLFKLFAALCVLAVMSFTGMLAYHVVVAPLGGVFEKIIPNSAEIAGKQPDADFAKMLDSAALPDIDPGEKAFQKAHELLALGNILEAREKLINIVTSYPSSPSAPVARRIVGEMNLDEILSTAHMEGKQAHVVKRGNSFLSIAAEHSTTLDCIMYLNGMMELKNIQPGEELVVMPLNFRLLIEPQRKVLSIWDGGRFIREYPILQLGVPGKLPPRKTKISSKSAELDGHQIAPQSKDYRTAEKVIQIAKPSLQIRSGSETAAEAPHGIVMRSEDMEEISLLTRVGNEVEIR